MEYTYVQLGILSRAFDYVYEHILSPVFNVLGNLISTIHKTLFENLFMPLLELHFKISLGIIARLLENFIYNLLFRLARVLLWVLDSIERVFRTFAGLNPVYVMDDNGRMVQSGSLLLTMAKNRYIQTALAGMIMASFVLCFLIALFATIRSSADTTGKRPVSKVMRLTAQAMLRLILIPIMSLGIIALGDAVFQAIENATNATHTPVSNIIFTMSTLDAIREQDIPDAVYYNSSTRSAALAKNKAMAAKTSDYGMMDKYRKPWYLGERERGDINQVLRVFDIRRIDYIVLIGLTIAFIFIFGILAVNMSARIFDCLVLLLVEPFFAATIPLDEGEKFEKWQDIFIGRMVSGYGTVVAVNLYLGIIGMLFAGKIDFFGPGTTPAVEYLVKILFTGIGAWTIIRVGPVVTGIMSAQGGSREAEVTKSSTELTGKAAAFLTKPLRFAAKELGSRAFGAAKDAIAGLLQGGSGGSGGGGGISPNGIGAFGQMYGSGPTGVQFYGSPMHGGVMLQGIPGGGNRPPVSGVPGTGPTGMRQSGGMPGTGPAGVQFGGRKGADGKTIKGSTGTGKGFGTPELDDGFETVFDIGDGTLFDEVGEDDGFDTIFDVGGRSLFDEDAGPVQGFSGTGPMQRHDYGGMRAGLDAPLGSMGGGNAYGFLAAGNAPGLDNLGGYTWIGQEDEKEREEKKKFEEQLKTEIDQAALDAAESETGMDLNGDGKLEGINDIDLFGTDPVGSINDVDGEPLSMEDIFGGSDQISNDKLFGSDQISNDKLFGSDQISNDKLFGSDQVTDDKLFGSDPFDNLGQDDFPAGSINDPDEEED